MMMLVRLRRGRRGLFPRVVIVRARHRPTAGRERRRSREPHDEQQTERANRECHRLRQIYHNCVWVAGAVVMVDLEGRMERDVVCGMDVDPAKAAATSEYNGKTYYFCAKACKIKFDVNPSQYVSKG